jgi:hypothetical protein
MASSSRFNDQVTLLIGEEKYSVPMSRLIAREFPLLRGILTDEPDVKVIRLQGDKVLTDLLRVGLDFFLGYAYIFDDLLGDPSMDVLIAALQWAQIFGLTEESPIVDRLLAKLSQVKKRDDKSEDLQLMVKDGFITSKSWLEDLGFIEPKVESPRRKRSLEKKGSSE